MNTRKSPGKPFGNEAISQNDGSSAQFENGLIRRIDDVQIASVLFDPALAIMIKAR